MDDVAKESEPFVVKCVSNRGCLLEYFTKFITPNYFICKTYKPRGDPKQGMANGLTLVFLTGGGIVDMATFRPDDLTLYIPGFDAPYFSELGIDGVRVMIHPEGNISQMYDHKKLWHEICAKLCKAIFHNL